MVRYHERWVAIEDQVKYRSNDLLDNLAKHCINMSTKYLLTLAKGKGS